MAVATAPHAKVIVIYFPLYSRDLAESMFCVHVMHIDSMLYGTKFCVMVKISTV